MLSLCYDETILYVLVCKLEFSLEANTIHNAANVFFPPVCFMTASTISSGQMKALHSLRLQTVERNVCTSYMKLSKL